MTGNLIWNNQTLIRNNQILISNTQTAIWDFTKLSLNKKLPRQLGCHPFSEGELGNQNTFPQIDNMVTPEVASNTQYIFIFNYLLFIILCTSKLPKDSNQLILTRF